MRCFGTTAVVYCLTLFWAVPLLVGGERRDAAPAWQERLERELPLLGHRNWIVIADAAYPAQAGGGIETIHADIDHASAVEVVLGALGRTRHVQAAALVDVELDAVAEADAPGIAAYRGRLGKLLQGQHVERLPHEEIIRRLDEAGRVFRVLVIKTNMTLPYTSVFLPLQCGYWSADKEARLRATLESRTPVAK